MADWSTALTQIDDAVYSTQLRSTGEVINYLFATGTANNSVPACVFSTGSDRQLVDGVSTFRDIQFSVLKTSLTATPGTGDSMAYNSKTYQVINIIDRGTDYVITALMQTKDQVDADEGVRIG